MHQQLNARVASFENSGSVSRTYSVAHKQLREFNVLV